MRKDTVFGVTTYSATQATIVMTPTTDMDAVMVQVIDQYGVHNVRITSRDNQLKVDWR